MALPPAIPQTPSAEIVHVYVLCGGTPGGYRYHVIIYGSGDRPRSIYTDSKAEVTRYIPDFECTDR